MPSEEAVFHLGLDWITRLAKAYQTLRKKHEAALIELSDEFGPFHDVARFYVEPDCQQINPADKDEDEAISVVRSPVFRTLQEFFSGSIISRTGESQMFVLGDAGMGKTSLLLMLKLAHLNALWPRGYKCELLKVKDDTIERIASMPDHANTILLLDSIDEDPKSWADAPTRIEGLLTETIRFRRVVITCRTQFFPSSAGQNLLHERYGYISIGPFSCPSIYLSPFNGQQVESYLAKRFPKSFWQWLLRRSNPKHECARRLVNVMNSLRMRPMLLSYIDQLIDASLSPQLSYDVYNTLIDYWLRREEVRAKLQRRSSLTAESLWDACVILASHLDGSRRQVISGAELLATAQRDPALRELEFLDFSGRSLLNRTSDGSYRFAHYSLQEFILARAVIGARGARRAQRIREIRGTTEVAHFLSEANRSQDGCRLADVDFEGTTFSNLDLRGLRFERCVFRRTKFQRANLRGCRFDDCTFIECDFRGADLADAVCSGRIEDSFFDMADFSRADMKGVMFVSSCDSATIAANNETILPQQGVHCPAPDARIEEEAVKTSRSPAGLLDPR